MDLSVSRQRVTKNEDERTNEEEDDEENSDEDVCSEAKTILIKRRKCVEIIDQQEVSEQDIGRKWEETKRLNKKNDVKRDGGEGTESETRYKEAAKDDEKREIDGEDFEWHREEKADSKIYARNDTENIVDDGTEISIEDIQHIIHFDTRKVNKLEKDCDEDANKGDKERYATMLSKEKCLCDDLGKQCRRKLNEVNNKKSMRTDGENEFETGSRGKRVLKVDFERSVENQDGKQTSGVEAKDYKTFSKKDKREICQKKDDSFCSESTIGVCMAKCKEEIKLKSYDSELADEKEDSRQLRSHYPNKIATNCSKIKQELENSTICDAKVLFTSDTPEKGSRKIGGKLSRGAGKSSADVTNCKDSFDDKCEEDYDTNQNKSSCKNWNEDANRNRNENCKKTRKANCNKDCDGNWCEHCSESCNENCSKGREEMCNENCNKSCKAIRSKDYITVINMEQSSAISQGRKNENSERCKENFGEYYSESCSDECKNIDNDDYSKETLEGANIVALKSQKSTGQCPGSEGEENQARTRIQKNWKQLFRALKEVPNMSKIKELPCQNISNLSERDHPETMQRDVRMKREEQMSEGKSEGKFSWLFGDVRKLTRINKLFEPLCADKNTTSESDRNKFKFSNNDAAEITLANGTEHSKIRRISSNSKENLQKIMGINMLLDALKVKHRKISESDQKLDVSDSEIKRDTVPERKNMKHFQNLIENLQNMTGIEALFNKSSGNRRKLEETDGKLNQFDNKKSEDKAIAAGSGETLSKLYYDIQSLMGFKSQSTAFNSGPGELNDVEGNGNKTGDKDDNDEVHARNIEYYQRVLEDHQHAAVSTETLNAKELITNDGGLIEFGPKAVDNCDLAANLKKKLFNSLEDIQTYTYDNVYSKLFANISLPETLQDLIALVCEDENEPDAVDLEAYDNKLVVATDANKSHFEDVITKRMKADGGLKYKNSEEKEILLKYEALPPVFSLKKGTKK